MSARKCRWVDGFRMNETFSRVSVKLLKLHLIYDWIRLWFETNNFWLVFHAFSRFVFLAIYSAEMVIKIIAKGFALNKYTYLRNPWNWLDFVVITSGYATIGLDVGNLAGLRTFRVLRALKTVSIMPGRYFATSLSALFKSWKRRRFN